MSKSSRRSHQSFRQLPYSRRISLQFGQKLKQARRRAGCKQEVFAEEMGVSRTTASNIERGKQRVFLDQLYTAAVILGVDLSELLPEPAQIGQDVVVRTPADAPLKPDVAKTLGQTVKAVVQRLRRQKTAE